jgi:hypothetical protein
MIAYTSRPSAYASSHFSWTFADVRKSALILSTSSQSDLHRIIRMVNSCLTFDTGVKSECETLLEFRQPRHTWWLLTSIEEILHHIFSFTYFNCV